MWDDTRAVWCGKSCLIQTPAQAFCFSACCRPRGGEASLSHGISSFPPTCLSISLPKKQNSKGHISKQMLACCEDWEWLLKADHRKSKADGDQGSKKDMRGLRRCMGMSITSLLHLLPARVRGTDTWLETPGLLPLKSTECRLFSWS